MLYPVAGIVAEYNPLHKGHLYHIKKARELCSAEAVAIVLSSDFVQRGEPALLDKWTRAEAALRCGVDLVIELPVIFSSHNAGVFANAAVDDTRRNRRSDAPFVRRGESRLPCGQYC